MDWLKAVAQLVSKEGQPMSWITPLGLPVLQPYRRTNTFQVRFGAVCCDVVWVHAVCKGAAIRYQTSFGRG